MIAHIYFLKTQLLWLTLAFYYKICVGWEINVAKINSHNEN